jgi:hypothetical protein
MKNEEEKSYFDNLEHNLLSDEDSQEWKRRIEELYKYLRDIEKPKNIVYPFRPKLSHDAASTIIWFLQEQTGIIPDHFEFCSVCGDEVYDSHREGHWSDIVGKGFCDNHAWDNSEIAFCADCGYEVPLKKFSKRYGVYLCKNCRKKRKEGTPGTSDD